MIYGKLLTATFAAALLSSAVPAYCAGGRGSGQRMQSGGSQMAGQAMRSMGAGACGGTTSTGGASRATAATAAMSTGLSPLASRFSMAGRTQGYVTGTSGTVSGFGTVTGVNPAAGTFAVQAQGNRASGVLVTTSGNTQCRRSDGTTATFADLTVGTSVAVQGVQTRTGAVGAQQVIVLDSTGSSQQRLTGGYGAMTGYGAMGVYAMGGAAMMGGAQGVAGSRGGRCAGGGTTAAGTSGIAAMGTTGTASSMWMSGRVATARRSGFSGRR